MFLKPMKAPFKWHLGLAATPYGFAVNQVQKMENWTGPPDLFDPFRNTINALNSQFGPPKLNENVKSFRNGS